MGYLLPIRPYPSEQYANRSEGIEYDFAKLERLERIHGKTIFSDDLERRVRRYEERKRQLREERKHRRTSFSSESIHHSPLFHQDKIEYSCSVQRKPRIMPPLRKGLAVDLYS